MHPDTPQRTVESTPGDRINWLRSSPFIAMHGVALACLLCTTIHWWLFAALYGVLMFCITAGFHRYFSHRTYKTSRVMQFILAYLGTCSAQRGVLWWASLHRDHHTHSDTDADVHTPHRPWWWDKLFSEKLWDFFWSHMGWIMTDAYAETRWDRIKDFAKYPELVFINKFHLLPPITLGTLLLVLGGWSMVATYLLTIVVVWHATFCVNSVSHIFGSQAYATQDQSRNSFLMALLTFGEGWHNNHHQHPNCEPQGMRWWQIDLSHYILTVLGWLHIVWDIRRHRHS